MSSIDWNRIPWRSSPELYQECRAIGSILPSFILGNRKHCGSAHWPDAYRWKRQSPFPPGRPSFSVFLLGPRSWSTNPFQLNGIEKHIQYRFEFCFANSQPQGFECQSEVWCLLYDLHTIFTGIHCIHIGFILHTFEKLSNLLIIWEAWRFSHVQIIRRQGMLNSKHR